MFFDLTKNNKTDYFIKEPGKYLFFFFNKGGSFKFHLLSPNAKVYILGLFVGKRNDNFEVKTLQHHATSTTLSHLFVKGVFFEESRFIYEGTIKIEKRAQKTFAYQKNQNLIMSDRCFVDSRPFLEIMANDVFCTHGSTTGKLDEEQIYYLKTRGIKTKKAKELLIEGFLEEVFLKAKEWGFAKEILPYKNKALSLL